MVNMNLSRHYIERIIDQHQQITRRSCVPSAVEMILKLLGKVNSDYYDLQNSCTNGHFSNFDGQTISDVIFHRVNLAARGHDFPYDQLFSIIDQELASNRYVMISLLGMSSEGARFHAYVIYDIDPQTNDYLTVTKASQNGIYVTQFESDIKSRVREIQGTDILLYTLPITQGSEEEQE